MAQNIHLRDRVRFLPGLKKKDLPTMFDCKFVATVDFAYDQSSSMAYPSNFSLWQDQGYFNYDLIIGSKNNDAEGNGVISEIDFYIFQYGTVAQPIKVVNPAIDNRYEFYYGGNTKEDGSHSGFVYYTIYNIEPVSVTDAAKSVFKMSIDIWESNVMINDATVYEDIN